MRHLALAAAGPDEHLAARLAAAAQTACLRGTSGQHFTVVLPCAACLNSSAQVTAGSPRGVPPADFGTVHFTGIIVKDSAGVSGGLKNAQWGTLTLVQPGSPHTIAGPLHTVSAPPPAHSSFADNWAP